jgi:hypothetical protein
MMNFIRIIVCCFLIVGCGADNENANLDKSSKKQPKSKTKVIKDVKVPNQKFKTYSIVTEKSDLNKNTEIKYVYYSGYKIHLDTNNVTLKIAENVITFFIPNENHKDLVKFKNKGFPMEFWATEMCPFFHIPISEMKEKIAIAKKLGYPDYGYKCEVISKKSKEDKILTNQIRISFKIETPNDLVQDLLSNKNFDEINSFVNRTYEIKLKNRTPNSLIKQYKTLRGNNYVENVEFIFGGCDYNIPLN